MLWQKLVLRCQFANVRGMPGPKCQGHGLEQQEREAEFSTRDVEHQSENLKGANSKGEAESKEAATVQLAECWTGPQEPRVPLPNLPAEVMRAEQVL